MIRRWWRRWQRRTDVEVLWPRLQEDALDHEHAVRAFAMHMEIDPAYRDMDDQEKLATLINLPRAGGPFPAIRRQK